MRGISVFLMALSGLTITLGPYFLICEMEIFKAAAIILISSVLLFGAFMAYTKRESLGDGI